MTRNFKNQKITNVRANIARVRNNFILLKKVFLLIQKAVNENNDEKEILKFRKKIK